MCGQCEKSGAQCIYPQTFKRGFPEGYLAAIETRLIQTERALFEALSASNGIDLNQIPAQSVADAFDTKTTKSARMEEWNRLPLLTAQDRQTWCLQKAETIGLVSRSPTRRQGDGSMTHVSLPHAHHDFQGENIDSSTSLWHQPYARNASLPTGSDHMSELFSPQRQEMLDSEPPLTPIRQVQSSTGSGSAGMRTVTTPQDLQRSSMASILSVQQSRRFF